jgi:hypothetical protein
MLITVVAKLCKVRIKMTGRGRNEKSVKCQILAVNGENIKNLDYSIYRTEPSVENQ